MVLTGSSSSEFRESVGVLAGRRGNAIDPDRVLLPMGFDSFVAFAHAGPLLPRIGPLRVSELTRTGLREAAHELAPWIHVLTRVWETYLLVGGFPEAVADHLASFRVGPVFRCELLRVITGDSFRHARLSDLADQRPPASGSPGGWGRWRA